MKLPVSSLALAALLAAVPAFGQELKTENDKTLYALGLAIGRSLGAYALKPAELEIVKRGIADMVTGAKPKVELEAYGPKIGELAKARLAVKTEADKAKGKAFLESAAKEKGATKTASGLVYKTLSPGSGPSPKATSTVKVHYHGTLIDGTVFDSSVKRGQPSEFSLAGVVACWTEGVQMMKVGEKARLVCPSSIAYGDRGSPPTIPGGATLVFEVELLEIK